MQRLREQIKQWIGLNDVKNKDPLIETRRKIEMNENEIYTEIVEIAIATPALDARSNSSATSR